MDAQPADPVAQLRANLWRIVALTTDLLTETTHAGTNSTAATHLAPGANPVDYQRRHTLGDTPDDWSARVWPHPGYTLAVWEWSARVWLHHPTPHTFHTIGSARYLDTVLTDLHHATRYPWARMSRDLTRVRAHLETVMHDSRQPETGAPCPDCTNETDGKTGPPLVKHYADDPSGALDWWSCKRCGGTWTDAVYRLRVADVYRTQARWLRDTDAAQTYRVPAATIRRWASTGHVTKRRNQRGHVEYNTRDIEHMREQRDARGHQVS